METRATRHRGSNANWRRTAVLVIGVLALGVSAFAQSGGGYVIKKSTIDSGGGTVTGGDYRLSGTVGQHDAGPVSGGDYVLTGGFWSPATESPPCPIPDPGGLYKTRFISISIPPCETQSESAIRVRLTSLHHVAPPYAVGASVAFTQFEGQVRWVGPPADYVESSSTGTPFKAATLQCTPHYQDWTTVGLLHITGSAIVPSSQYQVENMAAACQGNEAGCASVSAAVTINTTRWGDVEVPYNPPSTTAQPDVGDISALVNKFRSAPGAPIKARALLAGADAFGHINIAPDLSFTHIAACVDAFRGQGYPYKPGKCATSGVACIADSECGPNGPCQLYCP